MEVGASAYCSEAVAGLHKVGTSFQQGTDHQVEVGQTVVQRVGLDLEAVDHSLEKAGPEEVGQILEKMDEVVQSLADLPLFRRKDKEVFRWENFDQAHSFLEEMAKRKAVLGLAGCMVPPLAEEIVVLHLLASLAVLDKVVLYKAAFLLILAFELRMLTAA